MSRPAPHYPPLTREQQRLVADNRRLVKWVANQYTLDGKSSFDDFVSEGNVGLCIAASRRETRPSA